MFNIVKLGDLMLGRNVTKQEAEKAATDYGKDDYGREYIVVEICKQSVQAHDIGSDLR